MKLPENIDLFSSQEEKEKLAAQLIYEWFITIYPEVKEDSYYYEEEESG